jgi:hypothetical protein
MAVAIRVIVITKATSSCNKQTQERREITAVHAYTVWYIKNVKRKEMYLHLHTVTIPAQVTIYRGEINEGIDRCATDGFSK